MSSPYPILFVIPNLGGGGAERAMLTLLNHLDRSRFQPHLALFQKEGVFLKKLAADIPLYELQPQESSFLGRNWTRFRGLRDLQRKIHPALIVSFLWQANAVTLLAARLWGFSTPVIINEQTAPQSSLASDPRRRRLWPLAKRVNRLADKIVVISQGIARELANQAGISPSRIEVIPNPVPLAELRSQAQEPVSFKVSESPAILAAGRLTPLKNYPLLLRAVAQVLQTCLVELYILGDGPQKAELEALARSLGISDHLHLLGFVPNPYARMAQADLFVLSSNHEGFGNVLVEALALGLPVIATDCPYGPAEILDGGKYGRLVPVGDVQALAEAILDWLDHSAERQRFARLGPARAEAYSLEAILPRYQSLFLSLIEK